MPRGYADFGLNPSNYGQYSGDIAELASRLLSPVVFERRGRVLWFDDMSNGISKYKVNLAGTATFDLTADIGFLNGCCLRLVPDAAAVQKPLISWTLPIISETKLGLEFLIRWVSNNDANCTSCKLSFYYHDGTNQYTFYQKWRPVEKDIQLNASAPPPGGLFTVISSPWAFWGTGSEPGTNYFKVVIDLSTKAWDRMVFNQTGVSLKQYVSTVIADTSRPRLDVVFYCDPNAAVNAILLSDPIVTIDEP